MTAPYHLAVIGTRFPQLALGTLLARRGRSVVIVDASSADGTAGCDRDGYRFRKRPVPMSGLDSGGFLRLILDEIGIGRVLVNETYPANEVSYQVVLPRHRINIYPERDRLMAEIAREFPGSLDTFRELYREWDTIASDWYRGQDNLADLEKGWLQTSAIKQRLRCMLYSRRLGERIRSLDAAGPESAYFALQHQFLGAFGLEAVIPSLPAALIHSIGRRGTHRDTSGAASLTSLVLQRFKEYGGELIDAAGVISIENDPREGLFLNLENGPSLHARSLCTTAGLAEGVNGLGSGVSPRGPREPAPEYPVRFYLGVLDKYVPEGMADNLFLMREDDGGPLKMRSCYLALSPRDSDMAPDGRRSLTVTSLLSGGDLDKMTPELVEDVKGDMLGAMENVIPFLGEGMTMADSDLEPRGDFRASRALPGGVAAWSPGIIGRMAVSTALKGRAAIIRPTPWELGVEGEALAALAAAGVLKKNIGLEA